MTLVFFFCLFVVYAPHPLFNYSIVVVSIRLPLRILLFALASVCFIRRNFARFIFNSRCSSVVFFNYSNLLFYFAFNCCTNLKMYNIIIKKNWSLCITCIYIWLCGIGNAYSLQSDSGPKAGRRDRGGGGGLLWHPTTYTGPNNQWNSIVLTEFPKLDFLSCSPQNWIILWYDFF